MSVSLESARRVDSTQVGRGLRSQRAATPCYANGELTLCAFWFIDPATGRPEMRWAAGAPPSNCGCQ